MVSLILPVDQNMRSGRMMICSRAVMSRRKKRVVRARHSDDQVRVRTKRYKQSVKILVVNSEYLISGPHKCESI